MPPEYRLRPGGGAEEYAFDELAKEVASGTISRGRALKLAGAAILGSTGLLALFPSKAQAQGGGCPEDEVAFSNRSCSSQQCGVGGCLCVKTVHNNKRCVTLVGTTCPRRDECNRNRGCPGDQICIKMGCPCGVRRRNICARPCP